MKKSDNYYDLEFIPAVSEACESFNLVDYKDMLIRLKKLIKYSIDNKKISIAVNYHKGSDFKDCVAITLFIAIEKSIYLSTLPLIIMTIGPYNWTRNDQLYDQKMSQYHFDNFKETVSCVKDTLVSVDDSDIVDVVPVDLEKHIIEFLIDYTNIEMLFDL